MQTLTSPCTHHEDIKKSRFLAYAAPVVDAPQAMAFFAAHSDPAATHNCWAYRIGTAYRFNDDGEPGGTAGRPILQAIEGQGLDRVAVLVVRWFGGIKLGTGGLVRAYGACAANCLRLGDRIDIISTTRVRCQLGFAELPLFRSRLAQAGAAIVAEAFGADGVVLTLDVPQAALAELELMAANIMRGRAQWQIEKTDQFDAN